MSGTIHRQKKNREFITIDTHCLRNKDLKWDAKGLHSYLMQLPDDWKINISDLENRGADGRDATNSPMKALIQAGYVYREQVYKNGKFEGYDYHLFERPEQGFEWLTTNGKSVNGKSVNGKSVTSKELKYPTDINKNEGSKAIEKKSPPKDFDEMIDMVNAQAEQLKALKPITKPTHIVTTVEAVELPKFYQPTNPDAAAKLLSRLEVKPKASDAIEAEKCITDWAFENIETVKSRYGSWRKYTQDDLKETIVKFCAWFSNHREPGTQLRFLSDPALFFRNRLTAWLIEQNKHDTEQAAKAQKPAYQQPEQKYTPPQKPTPPQAYYD